MKTLLIFVSLIQLSNDAENFCKIEKDIEYKKLCYDNVVECLWDGESLEFCSQDWLNYWRYSPHE